MAEDDWGEFEFAVLTTPHPLNLYSKGSAILYQTREGTWVPGKVNQPHCTKRQAAETEK